VDGERLRTIRLKGQISQGLLLPLYIVYEQCGNPIRYFNIGDDLTILFGVIKWEKEIPAQLAGTVKGNFPEFLRKTDQPRIQNVYREIIEQPGLYEITEKLDGSSMTVYLYNDPDGLKSGVCSRNLDLKPDPSNAFWSVVFRDDIINKMTRLRRNLTLQGELVGPGVQKNPYQLSQLEFYVFDIFDIDAQEYLFAGEREAICQELDIKHVPMLGFLGVTAWDPINNMEVNKRSVKDILAYAEGPSMLNPKVEREGLVWKSILRSDISFKAISNKWLLKEKE